MEMMQSMLVTSLSGSNDGVGAWSTRPEGHAGLATTV